MTTYALFFSTETQCPASTIIYKDGEIPPASVWPPEQELVTFDETSPDFNLLYGLFVEDKEKIYTDYAYLHTKYNSSTGTFTFVLKEITPNIEIIRQERNARITATDKFMFAPDIPDSLKNDLLAYRQALRDITSGLDADATVMTVNWPTIPVAFTITPMPV